MENNKKERLKNYVGEKENYLHGCLNPLCNDKLFCDFIKKSSCLEIIKERNDYGL